MGIVGLQAQFKPHRCRGRVEINPNRGYNGFTFRRFVMDQQTFAKESTLNRQAYKQLREHIRSEYAGKYVALAHGKVLGGASTFDSARALVAGLDHAPEYYLVFAADAEPDFDLVYDLAGSM
jgi:alkanesulfonate monooxygenase SsuD/methylene tetrahydromethanopterin reductase-like flavin-dependent oxidoreductase (luciferase family)